MMSKRPPRQSSEHSGHARGRPLRLAAVGLAALCAAAITQPAAAAGSVEVLPPLLPANLALVQPVASKPRMRFDPGAYSSLNAPPNIPLALEGTLASLRVSSTWEAVRNGVGFDLGMPNAGNLFLNLYARKNSFARGQRWSVSAVAPQEPVWSAGATADLIRDESGRRLVLIPQLSVDLSRAIGAPGQMHACLQRAYWGALDPLARGGDQLMELSFRWRF